MSRTAFVVSLLICVSCLPPKPASEVAADTSYDNIRWVRKAARALWREPALNVTPEIQALAAKPRAEIVQEMMKDPRFSDSLFDFFLYFLSAKSNSLEPGFSSASSLKIDPQVLRRRPQASIAAKEAFFGRDFSMLFDLRVKTALLRNGQLVRKAPQDIERAFAELESLIKEVQKRATSDAAAFCNEMFPGGQEDFSDFGSNSGVANNEGAGNSGPQGTKPPPKLTTRIRTAVRAAQIGATSKLDEQGFGGFDANFNSDCLDYGNDADFKPKISSEAGTRLAEHTARLLEQLPKLKQQVISTLQYAPIHISDIAFEDSDSEFQMSQFWNALPNSSTNYNRKRAEYMLKTYFCDEMTPLAVVASNSDKHSQNRHPADAGCRACHYKLDPMAGHFRYYSAQGQFARDLVQFDDGKEIRGPELDKYLASWRDEQNSQKWNIGYIRSNTDPRKNHFGDDLKDLFAFIKTAPEVRQCLVKRLAKYYVSETQAFDGEWLSALGRPLHQAPQSGAALKQVVAGLIASNTFAAADPKADQCYDYVGGAPTSAVPCAVAHIIKEKCSSCHSADNAEGGLDLTSWRNSSFIHSREGKPVARQDTLTSIQKRINTLDPNLLMPQSGELSAQERQALYSWLEGQLTGGVK